jgi:hypothetical protein
MAEQKYVPEVKRQPLPYCAPVLTVFGDIRSLTANGSGPEMEGGLLMQMG